MKNFAIFLILAMAAGAVFAEGRGRYDYAINPLDDIDSKSNVLIVTPKDNLQAKYDWLKSSDRDAVMGALSYTNWRTLMLAPGRYTVPITGFLMDCDYIAIVGMGNTSREVTITSADIATGTTAVSCVINQTAKCVALSNLTVEAPLHADDYAFAFGLMLNYGGMATATSYTHATKVLVATGIGNGIVSYGKNARYDEVYVWGAGLTAGWYEILTVTDSDTIVLNTSPGTATGDVYYILCPQQSRYTDLRFRSRKQDAINYNTTSSTQFSPCIANHCAFGGTWDNCEGTHVCFKVMSYESFSGSTTVPYVEDVIAIDAFGVASEDGTNLVGIPSANHNIAPGQVVMPITAAGGAISSYDRNRYRVKSVVYGASGKIQIEAKYVAHTFNADDRLMVWRYDMRPLMRNCLALSYSFGGDLEAWIGGRYENCRASNESFGGCTSFGSNVNGTFINCISGRSSFGKNAEFAGLAINCISGTQSFAGYSGSGLTRFSGEAINCMVDAAGTVGSFGHSTTSYTAGRLFPFTGKLINCRIGTLSDSLAGTLKSGIGAGYQGYIEGCHPARPTNCTAAITIRQFDNGHTYTNTGATGAVTLTLPPAEVGLKYHFRVTAAQELRLDPSGTETVAINGTQQAAGLYISADAVGAACTLECVVAGQWEQFNAIGTWTVEP